jgi:hypothetical protein
MEFSINDLNRIIMDLSNEPSDSNEEEQTLTATNNITDRQYYLIIFNNRTWSQRLQKRSPPVVYNLYSA